MGKKNKVRNTWEPRLTESTSSASSAKRDPHLKTMVHSIRSRVFLTAVIILGSVVSSPGMIFR